MPACDCNDCLQHQIVAALHPVALRVLQPSGELVGIRVDEFIPAAACPRWISVKLDLVAGVVEPPQPLQPVIVFHDQNQVVQGSLDIAIAVPSEVRLPSIGIYPTVAWRRRTATIDHRHPAPCPHAHCRIAFS
ncbi:hypothetical protein D3C71_1195810 [compost metagenome]